MCDHAIGPDVSRETWRRARIAHRCCACRETIRPGDRYHYLSGVWDGNPGSYKHCARCWTLLDAITEQWIDDGSDFGPRLDLSCGQPWDFDAPAPVELAFVTADEAQDLVPQ